MMEKLIKKWMDVCYAAMMLGEKKDKAYDWQGRLKYIFDTYLFFLTISLILNIFMSLFPNNEFYKLIIFSLVLLSAIYIYGYNKSFEKLLNKLNYDPSVNYDKNTFRDFLSLVFLALSVLSIFLFFVFSFYLFNYFKFLIGF